MTFKAARPRSWRLQARVIVTCTKRKRIAAASMLRARELPVFESVEQRASEWIGRLSASRTPKVRARDLYAGDHWSISQSLASIATPHGHTLETWVMSAGYGLFGCDQEVHPYSATFSAGHVDDVAGRASDRSAYLRAWWNQLSRWEGLIGGVPRTLAQIAQAAPAAPIIVIASAPYLEAAKDDIVEAVDILAPGAFSVFSAGSHATWMQHLKIQYSAELQGQLGGSLMSLNVRAFRAALLTSRSLDRKSLQSAINAMPANRVLQQKLHRVRMSDQQVVDYIRAEYERSPVGHSPLHRRLRAAGYACEQGRFRELYQATIKDKL